MDPVLKSGFDPAAGEAVVMRMRLKQFCLGHYFLLEEIDSPFFNEFLPVTRGDLLKAVIVCSQPQAKARASLLSPTTWLVGYVLGLLNRDLRSLDPEISKFRRYLQINRELPAIRCPAGGRARNSPEAWRLLVMLTKDFRMTLQEARETSLRQANCLWAVQAELAGAIDMMATDPFNDERLRVFREFASERNRQN